MSLEEEYEQETGKKALRNGSETKVFQKWKNKKIFKMVIDTREQEPYDYENSVVKCLKTGDYSTLGYEDEMAVERKSLSDFVNSITKGRERFEREILRAKKDLKFFAIVVETDLERVWSEPLYSKINRRSITNAILFWIVKYNVPILFVTNRIRGKYAVRELCEAYVNYKTNDKYKELFEQIYG